jgi:hypothetical protein
MTRDVCVLCAAVPATTREHVPAELFFDRPLPDNLITVPACESCNKDSQHDDEYLRAFMMLLRDAAPSQAIERVRARTVRQLHRKNFPGLRIKLEQSSELRWHSESGGGAREVGLFTKPDRERLFRVMTKYVRGLYFHVVGSVLPVEAILSIERLFNRGTRPAEYWEPLLAASDYAYQGRVESVGAGPEFRYAFNPVTKGPALAMMVLEFYQSFPYVAMVFKPGTDLGKSVSLPF